MTHTIKFSVLSLAIALTSLVSADDVTTATVVDAHIKAVGSEAAIAKIKSFQRTAKVSFESQFGNFEGKIEEGCVVGKKSYQEMDLGVFAQSAGWDGDTAWANSPQTGVSDADENTVGQLKMSAGVDPIVALKSVGGLEAFEMLGEQDFDGTACNAIKIVSSGMVLYLDKESHMIVGMSVKVSDPNLGGEVTMKGTFEDYQEIEGVQFPNKATIDVGDGAMKITNEYTDTKVNVDIDESKFARPSA